MRIEAIKEHVWLERIKKRFIDGWNECEESNSMLRVFWLMDLRSDEH